MTAHTLTWPHGSATILTTAAMLADGHFLLDGIPFAPFARAPWVDQDTAPHITGPHITGHLRVLGGDFPCLPFGIGRATTTTAPDWSPLLSGPTKGPIHGPAAEEDWTVTHATGHAITLTLTYPGTSPVHHVTRTITARPDAPALDFTFTIHARHAAKISAGLHPILRLPEQPGRLHLSADFAFGLTHPAYGAKPFATLADIGLSHIPLTPRQDLNAQLCGITSPLRALYLDEGAGIELDWDRTLLPSLQIWHTDGGIAPHPWHNAYRGIGLEPIASAFDLDTTVSCAPNPISARGVATCIQLHPAQPTILRHSIRAFRSLQ